MGADKKDRPILFNGPMVRAILEGRKTQTRRALNPQPKNWVQKFCDGYLNGDGDNLVCRNGKVGDRLWVKETFHHDTDLDEYFYRSDSNVNVKWRPSIFMPRRASRILLEITNIRIERLDDITEDDAIAEGAARTDELTGCADDIDSARHAYKIIWESINGSGSWDANPFVWVIGFKVVNIRGDQT